MARADSMMPIWGMLLIIELAAATLDGADLSVSVMGAQEGHALLGIVVVYAGRGHHHLRVGQDNLNPISTAGDIGGREVGKVYIALDGGIDGNSHRALASGQSHAEGTAKQLATHRLFVVLGYYLAHLILSGI